MDLESWETIAWDKLFLRFGIFQFFSSKNSLAKKHQSRCFTSGMPGDIALNIIVSPFDLDLKKKYLA